MCVAVYGIRLAVLIDFFKVEFGRFRLPFSHGHILNLLLCKQKCGTTGKLRQFDCSDNLSHNNISI